MNATNSEEPSVASEQINRSIEQVSTISSETTQAVSQARRPGLPIEASCLSGLPLRAWKRGVRA